MAYLLPGEDSSSLEERSLGLSTSTWFAETAAPLPAVGGPRGVWSTIEYLHAYFHLSCPAELNRTRLRQAPKAAVADAIPAPFP
jgi:hypothetical protein